MSDDVSEARYWSACFRGRPSAGRKAIEVYGEIRAAAALFRFNLSGEQQRRLDYPREHLRFPHDNLFAAGFRDGTWLLGMLYNDPHLTTMSRQATRAQAQRLVEWFGDPARLDPALA